MGRRSIILLLTLAVLLQPAFASICMMQCPPPVTAQAAQPIAADGPHAHHHHLMSAACSSSLAMSASGMCDRSVDLRSSALVPATGSQLSVAEKTSTPEVTSQALSSDMGAIAGNVRFKSPLVVPLRI